MNTESPPAHQLRGKELQNGWKVLRRVVLPDGISGGWNSVSYIVRSDAGQEAFLKAFDYHSQLLSLSPPEKTHEITEKYLYERDILRFCDKEGLNHIVRIIDDGQIYLENNNTSSLVQYLIFEKADTDIRSLVGHAEKSKLAWTLRMMHQTIVATQQLHSKNIAHQDIKPHNLLYFNNMMVKLGDLGSATRRGNPSPNDHWTVAGDRHYSPPELLYGDVPSSWNMRRFGCDFYMLGSLLCFMCSGSTMNAIMSEKLHENFWPRNWTGSYNDVFFFVQNSFLQCINELKMVIHPAIASEVTSVIAQLCNPRPEKRGLPTNQGFNQYSLPRFVSILNRLYKTYELSPWRNEPISNGDLQ